MSAYAEEALKVYDPDRRCPKCGGHANVKHERMMGYDMRRLIRRCERCDYVWRELPLDAVNADPGIQQA